LTYVKLATLSTLAVCVHSSLRRTLNAIGFGLGFLMVRIR
jgi:hypothetical protein